MVFRRFAVRSGLLLTLAQAAMLAGCGGGDLPPAPRQTMVSRFAADTPNTIETTLTDPLPVKSASLKLPDGGTIAAERIERDRRVYSDGSGGGPDFGIGVAGGSSSHVSTGFGIGFPLFGGDGGNSAHTGAMTTSTLRFRVPDMDAYRRDWQRWVLHIDLDDGANRRSIETLPPAPPAE